MRPHNYIMWRRISYFHKFVLVLSIFLSYAVNSHKVIHTTSGLIESIEHRSPWGLVSIFYGIPYAKSPLLRFEPSVGILTPNHHFQKNSQDSEKTSENSEKSSENSEKTSENSEKISKNGEKSSEIVNSLVSPPACPQSPIIPHLSHVSIPRGGVVDENCLNLNVYIPSEGQNNNLPILVVVPGSGLSYGDAAQYDGSALASIGRIIVVTLNYRVGVFGFLSVGNSTLEGNAGLSDIINALNWIRVNGGSFGGNTNAITLAGSFSGSMLISAILTSPKFIKGHLKKPLAQRIILHGGIATGKWIFNPSPMDQFQKISSLTGCTHKSIDRALSCLRKISTTKLLEASNKLSDEWRLVIDHTYVQRDSLELIEFGQFPDNLDIMIGDNGGSGSLCYLTLLYTKSKYLDKINSDTLNEDDFKSLILESLNSYFKFSEDGLVSIVAHEYLYSGVVEKSLRDTYLHFCSSIFIRNNLELSARYMARFLTNIYRYEFSHTPKISPYPDWLPSGIGDELIFLFPTNLTDMTDKDLNVFQNFSGSWINFIKKGNPGPVIIGETSWPKFNEDSKKMVIFTGEGMKVDSSNFLNRDVHFWKDSFMPLQNLLEYYKMQIFQKNKESELKLLEGTSVSNYLQYFLLILGICFVIGACYYLISTYRQNKLLYR